jgi:hypothetical protein
MLRDVSKDSVLTYDDVELPAGRIADQLRAEQYRHFRAEAWLEQRASAREGAPAGVAAPVGGAS